MAMAIEKDLTPAQPLSPAGMVRISNGSRQRCIWPVHLSGWLALGWQLKQPMAGSASAQTTALASSPAPQPEVDTPAVDAAAAKRRGRKAKAAEPADTPEPRDSSLLVEIGAASSDANAAEPEHIGATTSDATPSDAAPVTAAEADSGGAAATSGFALPDDLLSAEF